MSLHEYQQLTEKMDQLRQELFASCEGEAENKNAIEITPEDSLPAPGLTPAMVAWYRLHVAPVRIRAIRELINFAEGIRCDHGKGVFQDFEFDKIEHEKKKSIAGHIDTYNNENKQELNEIATLKREYQDIRQAEGGRDAKVPNKWVEWGVLLPAIMVPEALLNYESFLAAPLIRSGAMALGSTLIVGVMIAVAAYCWGLYVRRFRYYRRPTDKSRSASGLPLIFYGLFGLAFGLGMVAAARYYFLVPQIQESIALGMPPPNVVMSISSLLLGNVVCLILGMVITFFFNDPNEEYQAKGERLIQLEKSMKAKRKSLNLRLEQIRQLAAEERNRTKNIISQMKHQPDFEELGRKSAVLASLDSVVVGALSAYRDALVAMIRRRTDRKHVFLQKQYDYDNSDSTKYLSLEEYCGKELFLSRFRT